MAAIQALTQAELEEYERTQRVTLLGHELAGSDLAISYKISEAAADSRYNGLVDGNMAIFLDSASCGRTRGQRAMAGSGRGTRLAPFFAGLLRVNSCPLPRLQSSRRTPC